MASSEATARVRCETVNAALTSVEVGRASGAVGTAVSGITGAYLRLIIGALSMIGTVLSGAKATLGPVVSISFAPNRR